LLLRLGLDLTCAFFWPYKRCALCLLVPAILLTPPLLLLLLLLLLPPLPLPPLPLPPLPLLPLLLLPLLPLLLLLVVVVVLLLLLPLLLLLLLLLLLYPCRPCVCAMQVVAHRLSTVEAADLIVVLNEGTVLEMGPHAELMSKGGRYAELVSKQSLK
jgi:hypothetical protein